MCFYCFFFVMISEPQRKYLGYRNKEIFWVSYVTFLAIPRPPSVTFSYFFVNPFPASRVIYFLQLLNLHLSLLNSIQLFFQTLYSYFNSNHYLSFLFNFSRLFSVFMFSFKANIKKSNIIHIFCVSNTLMLILCVKVF